MTMPVHPLTLQILRNYYQDVLPLREYVQDVVREVKLVAPDDPELYTALLDNAMVARSTADERDAPFLSYETPGCTQSELIDRVHAHLFASKTSRNVLTLGYRMGDGRDEFGRPAVLGGAVINYFVNTTVHELRSPEWQLLLSRIGERVMFHLLTKTSIFVALPNECLCQISGRPVTDLKPVSSFVALPVNDPPAVAGVKRSAVASEDRPRKRARLGNDVQERKSSTTRSTADVVFVRTRMFYARPTVDRKTGGIAVGLPPHHALNRMHHKSLKCKDNAVPVTDGDVKMDDDEEAVLIDTLLSDEEARDANARHVLKYIFPRQHGLHNVFTSARDSSSAYLFRDYTVREEEIVKQGRQRTPQRVNALVPLVQDLLARHSKCNYRAVRGRVCPSKLKQHAVSTQNADAILEMVSETSILRTQVSDPHTTINVSGTLGFANTTASSTKSAKPKPRFAEFAFNYYEVYSFVKDITLLVIPRTLWGSTANLKRVLKHVWTIISGRRFETVTLHTVMQGLSISDCDWLLPSGSKARDQRASAAENCKRRELFEEFVYWYFDSFVMPLLKTNFYITESSAYRNRVLYFRQDDWDALCAPLLDRLASSTFRRLSEDETRLAMRERRLGFSFVRLLPKETGIRPLVNLSYRSLVQQSNADGIRPQSINQMLHAAFQILTLEKNRQPTLLGASTFGLNDIYSKIKNFRVDITLEDGKLPKLYFVKVDVRACFDTIEQDKLLDILTHIISEGSYMLQKFGQVNPTAGKMRKSIRRLACAEGEHPHFLAVATDLAALLRHSIFVDHVVYSYEDRRNILALLREHITDNIVKIGDAYYRQNVGIPQGSVLSTLLCSFFYGDLERNELAFTHEKGNLLLRYVDDYCFVTTQFSSAVRFLDAMNAGHPEYGAFIVPEKTLANFDYDMDLLNRTTPTQKEFSWCGLLIDMENFSISVDYSRYRGQHLANFLTVDARRKAGKSFMHKMLRMGKHRTHILYCDTTLSTRNTVYMNVYQNMLLTAMKMHLYLKDLPGDTSQRRFVYDAIAETIRFTQISTRHTVVHGLAKKHHASCSISRSAVYWLGWHAFGSVMERKQSSYAIALPLVRAQRDAARYRHYEAKFKRAVEQAWQPFVDVIF